MSTESLLDGFDPLASSGPLPTAQDDPTKSVIRNILASYTGFFDLFSELIQNALDATQSRAIKEPQGYQPKIWLLIDMKNRRVRVVDNGVGMNFEEFKFCLRPNVTNKSGSGLRGNKGVGATYLAYGFSFIRLQTKQSGPALAAVLANGRRWAEDSSGSIPRPTLRVEEFSVPELDGEESGSCFEVIVGDASGERPRDLSWIGARNAEQWLSVLRIKTPLGGVYLTTTKFHPTVFVKVIDPEGKASEESTSNCEYYYPHEIPGKVKSLDEIQEALAKIQGDANTKFSKLPNEFKKLDCMYEIWTKPQLLADDSDFSSSIDNSDRELIDRHNVVVYAAFLSSAKQWSYFNDDVLGLRRGQRIMHGGLQLASDTMIQGDSLVIPLTSAIGYQANAHVIVHFTEGNPDMGRKVFQPELKALAEKLAVRVVTIFRRYLQHRKPDSGPPSITASRALHDWRRKQEDHRDGHPLSFQFEGRRISIISEPQKEQDVVALFHELLGIGLLRGYEVFATSQSEVYDSLYSLKYPSDAGFRFDRSKHPLGVSDRLVPSETEPKVLEFKFDFESLIDDFESELKSAEHIDLVVCWTTSKRYKDRFFFRSLLVGDEGSERIAYGATHQAFSESSQDRRFEVMVLKDLLSYLSNPSEEEARQKQFYKDE
jgi:hypothetical protein